MYCPRPAPFCGRSNFIMTFIKKYFFGASCLLALMLFLSGCATYNEQVLPYYKNVRTGNYTEAEKQLNRNSLIQKPRNQLLFLMEKGRISHLNGEYEKSNQYFNGADSLLENSLTDAGDAAVGVLVNSMSQRYKGEDVEKFMIHYYKALNYIYLGKKEDAIVEARRITLQAKEQEDKFNNKNNRYSNDAFSLMLQGMLYESDGDINNAFISYRNAVELYQNSPDKTWYGTSMPAGLKLDLIRTAKLNGFAADAEQYEKMFGITYMPMPPSDGGELVFFWENGPAPVKTQVDMYFGLIRNSNGDLFFSDATGGWVIPFNYTGDRRRVNTKSVESLRAAFPKYIPQNPYFTNATLSVDSAKTVAFEKTEDVNEIAIKTLQQRTLSEAGKVLSRLAVKKIAEYALREGAKSSNGQTNTLLEGLGYGMQLYSLLSEKADTRSWQSLPGSISYARIPLKKGENQISITLKSANGTDEVKTFKITGDGKLKFYNYASLR
jgi:hypothetical protein